ncbi:MAG TPA: hypothetical protein VKA70_19785 [Blastocatellia bacterium]|nr:hypothetical protein [Blastocatellia bacterium]
MAKGFDTDRSIDDLYSVTDLETLAKRQGVGPLSFDSLRAKASFWPEDESIDDFIATIRQWRDEDDQRN